MKFKQKSAAEEAAWATNFNNNILPIAQLLGMPGTDTATVQSAMQHMVDGHNAVINAQVQLKNDKISRDAAANTAADLATPYLVTLMNKPGFTDEHSQRLGLGKKKKTKNPQEYKPNCEASVVGTHPQLTFTKGIAKSIQVFGKLPGETDFVLIGVVTGSKFIDKRPLSKRGVAEIRQYYIVGLINDVPIGSPSDIVSIIYEG